MEQSIIDQLQKDAEQEIGPMPSKRGEIPDSFDTKENMMLTSLCSNSKQHVVKVAEKHYNIDYIDFTSKFHVWNKINNPDEY